MVNHLLFMGKLQFIFQPGFSGQLYRVAAERTNVANTLHSTRGNTRGDQSQSTHTHVASHEVITPIASGFGEQKKHGALPLHHPSSVLAAR